MIQSSYQRITYKGRKILVIGASGVGKTKLFNLINRDTKKDAYWFTKLLISSYQYIVAKVPKVDSFIQFPIKKFKSIQFTFQKKTDQITFNFIQYIIAKVPFTNFIFEQYKKSYKKEQKKLKSYSDFQQIKLIPNYEFVDTPTADFDSNVEIREQNIVRFQKFLVKNGHLICKFFIVVNFERTDLMKQKISGVFKYFRKYESQIGIIVTDFDLSENPEEDKQALIQKFNNAFKIPKESIVFINNTMSSQVVKKQILSGANIFSLKDTLFEIFTKEDEEREYRELTQRMNVMIPNANE